MGLKMHFRGQVDHLKTIIQDDPVPGEQIRRTFIYLYDTVPGGTGYLKDLLKDKVIIEGILTPALEKLRACDCEDGCYRCLFAYRNSYTRGSISKEIAISTLEIIVDKGEGLEKIRSIDDIDIHPLVDSALEAAFLRHLRQWNKASLVTQYRGTEKVYKLTTGHQTWMIECQVLLDSTVGVKKPSRPDFLFTPAGDASCLPIAVFMDGFTYHRDRLNDDTLKRMAILNSNRYLVWSLTWQDLTDQSLEDIADFFPLDTRRKSFTLFGDFIRKLESETGSLTVQKKMRETGSFDLLKAYLTSPDVDKWRALAYCHGIINVSENSSVEKLHEYAPDWFMEKHFSKQNSVIGAFWTQDEHEGCVAVNLVNDGTVDTDLLRAFVYLNDSAQHESSFRPVWNGFLRAMNMFQFLHPRIGFFCNSGLLDREYYDLLSINELRPVLPLEWGVVLEESAGKPYLKVLGRLADKNAPTPETDFKITDSNNHILTTSEIAWPLHKVALLSGECWEDHSECEHAGWRCYSLEELTLNDVFQILEFLRPTT